MTALYDFVAQAEGDLSFSAGDRIELIKRTDSEEDWWTGKLAGVEGVFPGKSLSLCFLKGRVKLKNLGKKRLICMFFCFRKLCAGMRTGNDRAKYRFDVENWR